MGYIITIIILAAIIEIFASLFFYDDYFDNTILSLIMSTVIVGLIAVVVHESETSEPTVQVQTTQLPEQLDEDENLNLVPDITGMLDDIGPFNMEDSVSVHVTPDTPIIMLKVKQPLVIPSNVAHIDSHRLNTDVVVTYNSNTREACTDGKCSRVTLLQHTDGSFWACMRSYGTCYQYGMSEYHE